MKTKLIAAIIGLFLCAAHVEAQGTNNGEVIPTSQNVLDGWFVTGAQPGQLQYQSFIDTMFWYANATFTNALAAQQSATVARAAAQTQIASVYFYFSGSFNGNPMCAIYDSTGVSSNSIGLSDNLSSQYSIAAITNYLTLPLNSSPPAFYILTSIPYGGGIGTQLTSVSGGLTGETSTGGSVVITKTSIIINLQGGENPAFATTNVMYLRLFQ